MDTLLSFRKGVSKKDNRAYCHASFMTPVTNRDRASGTVGEHKAFEVWMFAGSGFEDYLQPDMIGKNFNVFFNSDEELVVLECLDISKGGK